MKLSVGPSAQVVSAEAEYSESMWRPPLLTEAGTWSLVMFDVMVLCFGYTAV
jgi:hypothetical protein